MQHDGRVRDVSFDDKGHAFVPLTQQSSYAISLASDPTIQNRERHPRVFLKGDLRFSVTEQEIAHGPVIGHYTVETQDMQEPPNILWHAQNGRVLSHCAQSTYITFDLLEARAGQIWTSVITVQVTNTETFDTVIKGTFVQISVTKDLVPSSERERKKHVS